MRIDLEQALADMARSVHDDGAPDRMAGQVRTMVTRVRRRRAARHTATGVVGVGAVAAIAVGGLQLVSSPELAPVSPPSPTAATWACGTALPDDVAAAYDRAEIVHDAVATVGDTIDVEVGTGDQYAASPGRESIHRVVLTHDGVVVSGRAELQTAGLDPNGASFTFVLELTSCSDPSLSLPPGDYEVVALQAATLHTEPEVTRTEIRGRSTLRILDGEGRSADEEARGEEQVATHGAVAELVMEALTSSVYRDFLPTCGAVVQRQADGVPLTLDLGQPAQPQPVPGGTTIGGVVTLRTTGDSRVIGSASGGGATLVLTRTGVVVGTVYRDGEDVIAVDLGPDEALEIPLTGVTSLCTDPMTEGPLLALPPGTYQAYAVLEVAVDVVEPSDVGTVTGPTVVVSEPVDVEVG